MQKTFAVCKICGEPMPEGEAMFNYHGYSGPCPKPPLPVIKKPSYEELEAMCDKLAGALGAIGPADIPPVQRDMRRRVLAEYNKMKERGE